MAKYPDVTAGQTEACINRLGGWENFLLFIGGKGKVTFDAVTKTAEKANIYFRRLFGKKFIVISATDGAETFASSGLFTGGIYGEILPGVEHPVSTPKIKVTVNEQIKDGTFTELFGSIKAGEFEWEQSQVTRFCRDHRDKLRTNGYATFFRLKGGFVAYVRFGDGGLLGVSVCRFSLGSVWYSKCRLRIVVPQQ